MTDIEQIKQKLDIVDLISEYIPLKKMGRNFKTNCPFHNEKTPSFVVSPERQIWHCFGCNRGGDQFGFLMEYEKIEFAEALKYLADKAGVTLSGPVAKSEKESKKELIYSLNHLAASFYHFLLLHHAVGKKALSYLTDTRKIPTELVKKFNVGYAPVKPALSEYLMKKKGYGEQDLIDAGLAFKKDGTLFDFFRNRVIFPIADTRGNTIAFSGRSLREDDLPKYINTRETLVYRKGDTLFGLHLAREAIKKENRVIVVEGEFDVISAFKEGIHNIVAIKGTSLTSHQIKILKRFSEKVSFCFDTDPAGIEAQRRSIELIEHEGIVASVILPPHGKDPDELLREDPLLFKKAVKNEVNIYDFLIDSTVSTFDPHDGYGKRKILERLLPALTAIENEVLKEHYLKKLAKALDTSLESILKQAEKTKIHQSRFSIHARDQKESNAFVKKDIPREERIEQYLIALLLQSKKPQEALEKSMAILSEIELSTPLYRRIYHSLKDFTAQHVFSLNDFVASLPSELVEALDTCYLMSLPHFESERVYFLEIEKISYEVRTLALKNKLQQITRYIREKEKKGEDTYQLEEEFKTLTEFLQQSSRKNAHSIE